MRGSRWRGGVIGRLMAQTQRAAALPVALALLAALHAPVARASDAGAADAAEAPRTEARAVGVVRERRSPTRLDLAMAFLRLERAYRAEPGLSQRVPPEAMREANRLFDRATGEFFRGDATRVPALLARATSELLGEPAGVAALREALSGLAVAAGGSGAGVEASSLGALWPPTLIVPPSVEWDALAGATMLLREVGSGRTVDRLAIDPAAGADPDPAYDPVALRPGRFDIVLSAMVDEVELEVTLARGVLRSPVGEAERSALAGRIDALAEEHPAIDRHTIASLRYRASLLGGGEWRPELTPMLLDLGELHRSLETEIEFAEHAQRSARHEPWRGGPASPFASRAGDLVLAADHRFGSLPLRLYAPPLDGAIGDEPEPRPLVIAFHGAGVDEHLWFEGYGGGRLRALADRHGFVLVAPRAYSFMTDVTRLDAVIDAVRGWHSIDPDRVVVIGHSMGGVLCTALAQARADALAGAVCIAGARRINPRGPMAPTRFYAAGLDPIVPPEMVRRPARSAIEAGLPVELIDLPEQGHTLIVPAVLDEAIEWLMDRRRGAGGPAVGEPVPGGAGGDAD